MPSAKARYILLKETLHANRIDNMIGRVVRSTQDPLHEFAPDDNSGFTLSDIVQDLVDPPIQAENLQWAMKQSFEQGAQAQLSKLMNFHAAKSTGREGTVTSAVVTRYRMTNVDQKLLRLLGDRRYREAVMSMFDRGCKTPWFVTGMLTCRDTKLENNTKHQVAAGIQASTSGNLCGAPGASIEGGIQHHNNSPQSLVQMIKDEVVFALAYDKIKFENHWLWRMGSSPSMQIKSASKAKGVGPPVFSGSSSSSSDDELDDPTNAPEVMICVD